jgi:hypothetical protein
MPGWPDTVVDSGGDTPDVPLSTTTRGSPRHAGMVALGGGVPARVALLVRVGAAEGVPVALRVPDALAEGVPVAVAVVLDDGVPVWLRVPDALLEPVPVAMDEGVLVWLREALLEPEPVWLRVPDALAERVPVELLDALPDADVVRDTLSDASRVPGGAVRVADEALPEGTAVTRVAARQGSATPPAAATLAGTVASPSRLRPQQLTPPTADNAHVVALPAAIATCPPAATAAGTAVWLCAFQPQHATPPRASDSAHVW